MSAAQRMPILGGTLAIGLVSATMIAAPSLREAVSKYLGISAPARIWPILTVIFALLSIKSLPFVWHLRVFKNLIWHLYLQPETINKAHLFKPVITTSHNSISECDYNFHKSNSTYFADLDVGRAAIVGILLRTSLSRMNNGDLTGLPAEAKTAKGKYIVALGGVSCIFRKEIKPLEQYEVWSRLLTWDDKWLYIVSHVVKRGARKPASYFLQPWRKGPKTQKKPVEGEDKIKQVFATSLAKYVIKKGRLTIAPEIVLNRSDLLPEKPAYLLSPQATTDLSPGAEAPIMSRPEDLVADVMTKLRSEKAFGDVVKKDGEMTWEDVEKQRIKGLEIANCFDGMTALHGEWDADEKDVLGEYGDFFW